MPGLTFPDGGSRNIFVVKKQTYQFENFRVRKLEAINALNFYITLSMAFLAQEELSPETNAPESFNYTGSRSNQG